MSYQLSFERHKNEPECTFYVNIFKKPDNLTKKEILQTAKTNASKANPPKRKKKTIKELL